MPVDPGNLMLVATAAGRPVLCVEQGKALTTPPEGTPRVKDAGGKPLNIFSGCGVMAEYATLSLLCVVFVMMGVYRMGCTMTHGYEQAALELAERREELCTEGEDRSRAGISTPLTHTASPRTSMRSPGRPTRRLM